MFLAFINLVWFPCAYEVLWFLRCSRSVLSIYSLDDSDLEVRAGGHYLMKPTKPHNL